MEAQSSGWTDASTIVPTASGSWSTYIPPGEGEGDGDAARCGSTFAVPSCLTACQVPAKPKKAAVAAFVGPGNGGYVRDTTYKYVGLGSGEFELKKVPASLGLSPLGCYCLGGLSLLAPLLVAAIWLLFRYTNADGTTSVTPAREAQLAVAHEGPSWSYNCSAGRSSWQEHWNASKKAWCCLYKKFGCEQSASTMPYDCNADFLDWVKKWPKDKQVYCCLHKDRGCPRTRLSSGGPETTSTSLPFSCSVGSSNWVLGWSDAKKHWCCVYEGKGCASPSQAGTSPPDKVVFDCTAGLSNWRRGWSDTKAKWCCKRESVGCKDADPFDCDHDSSHWRSSWPDVKKMWCCKHHQKGCPDNPRFDCAAGYRNWTVAWADSKKTWCCEYEGRGCPYSCDQTTIDTWSEKEKSWCCQEKGTGCPEVVQEGESEG